MDLGQLILENESQMIISCRAASVFEDDQNNIYIHGSTTWGRFTDMIRVRNEREYDEMRIPRGLELKIEIFDRSFLALSIPILRNEEIEIRDNSESDPRTLAKQLQESLSLYKNIVYHQYLSTNSVTFMILMYYG